MRRKVLTVVIYVLAATANFCFMFDILNQPPYVASWLGRLLLSAIFWWPPLLLAFSYPRHLFADSSRCKHRLRLAAVLNSLGLLASIFYFAHLAAAFREAPYDRSGPALLLLAPLLAMPMFLVVALFLLLRGKSSLATLACAMLWPYWVALAYLSAHQWSLDRQIVTVFYFLSFLAPALFAFAIGALSYSRKLAHATAGLASLCCIPWISAIELGYHSWANAWTIFNSPDPSLLLYPVLRHAETVIISVALITLAFSTAGLRMLPSSWTVKRSPIRNRAWPALVITLCVLAVWFGMSAIPYHIPGQSDSYDRPILQILHVEKRGLQFHEACVSVWEQPSFSVSKSHND